MSILSIISKVAQWIPGRAEHRRNQIEKIELEMNAILKKGMSGPAVGKYNKLSTKLHKLRNAAKNV